ncbi:uncharacterized protein LOC134812009 [Bolinopsis microptera]|uniref:uncharacterized protein LOC134812009 n=1 Tax=Bolinopsis microptera TaxID=2820187 RepID=UPI00307999A9
MVRLLQYDPNCVIQSELPLPMEQMGQNHGVVVYQTMIPEEIPLPAAIDIDLYGDRVYVMTEDGEVQISSRNRPYKTFSFSRRKLYILVEDNGHSNTGHVRYSYKYYQKGIIGNVTANGQVLLGWKAFLISNFLPRGPYEGTPEEASKCSWRELVAKHGKRRDEAGRDVGREVGRGFIPTFYRATSPLLLESDTYVDTQGWGKGILLVLYNKATQTDAINLGRYWPLAGPQKRHYCPSPGPTRDT